MSNGSRKADALVVFGITGDLARKMTLRALYRLERRNVGKLRHKGTIDKHQTAGFNVADQRAGGFRNRF